MSDDIDLLVRYEVAPTSGSGQDLRIFNDLVRTRTDYTWEGRSLLGGDSIGELNRTLVVDTGIVLDLLNYQFPSDGNGGFSERSASSAFINDPLNLLYAANRTIVVTQSVEEELFKAWVATAGNQEVGQAKADHYKEWRNKGIKEGSVVILDDTELSADGTGFAKVRSTPEMMRGFAWQDAILPPFPNDAGQLSGIPGADFADIQLNLLAERSFFEDATGSLGVLGNPVFLSTSKNATELFNRDLNTSLSNNTLNFVEFLVNAAVGGSISNQELAEYLNIAKAGGQQDIASSFSDNGFGLFVPFRDEDGDSAGYYGFSRRSGACKPIGGLPRAGL